MQDLETILVLVGTFLPLIGTGLTVLLASISHGIFRWSVLFILPILTMLICWMIIDVVWKDGNMLAAALYLIYVVALFIYYPILTIIALIEYRNSKLNKISGT